MIRFRKIQKNAPLLLSIAASMGVIGVGVTSAMAATKIAQMEQDKVITKVKWVAIPVGIGAITILCIFESNYLNQKHQAAIVSAYTMLNQSYKAYVRKVKEIYGDDADSSIRSEIIKDIYRESELEIDTDELLFYDEASHRYFNKSMNEVKDAEYHLNRNFILRGYSYLNEFYEFLGIDTTEYGDVVGWSLGAESDYGYRWIDFYHEKVVMDDGLECYIIRYPFEPHEDFMEY